MALIKFDQSAPIERRVCSVCHETLEVSEFHKNRTKKDGLTPECRHCRHKQNKAYYSSPKGKAAVSGQTKRKWIRVKQRVSCRNQVNKAIQRGKILPKPCEVCGDKLTIEAHHDDYSKPFEINWLCKKHHLQRHGKMISEQ